MCAAQSLSQLLCNETEACDHEVTEFSSGALQKCAFQLMMSLILLDKRVKRAAEIVIKHAGGSGKILVNVLHTNNTTLTLETDCVCVQHSSSVVQVSVDLKTICD